MLSTTTRSIDDVDTSLNTDVLQIVLTIASLLLTHYDQVDYHDDRIYFVD
jgi:hypothetical protein